jgi:hypothetical protein
MDTTATMRYEFEELGELAVGDELELPLSQMVATPGGTRFTVVGPSDVYACEVAIRRQRDGEMFHYPRTWGVCKVVG